MRLRFIRSALIGLLIAAASLGLAATISFYNNVDFDLALLTKDTEGIQGAIFTDRYGRELRFLPDTKGERRRWLSGEKIPDAVKSAFIAAEDKRFYYHPGFDPIAILRALSDNLMKARTVSGASTISQQVIRLAYPQDGKKSYRKKIIEIIRSIKLENALSKEEILEQYLNRAPMGNNLIGIETAGRAYFRRSAKDLSASEAAFLASIPKAPGLLRPYGSNMDRLLARKDHTLLRMAQLGILKEEAYRSALNESLTLKGLPFDTKAPHLIDQLISEGYNSGRFRTTLDLYLQDTVQQVLASNRERLRESGASQAAAIVVHNPSMDVLATAGSFEYSEKDSGYNNGVLAHYSAGSTLKPFLYGLALESGYTATTLLEDTERKYRSRQGQYSPYNFDRKEYGPVTIRTALGNSLNLSAVRMLQLIGQERFYELLKDIKLINNPRHNAEHYGLGLAIGNPEVSLEQLAAAYAMLANNGVFRPVRYIKDKKESEGKRIFLPQTAYIIADILSDPSARMLTFKRKRSMDFPFRVAVKTGTSTFYRDLWAVGYTADYTVAVWVGNFDNSPTDNLSGSTAAAPILSEIMSHLYIRSDPTPFKRPDSIEFLKVCGYSGMKPSEYCPYTVTEPFISGTGPTSVCTFHTKKPERHELAAPYAGWLFEKNKTGSAGRFKLVGFEDDLNRVFQDPWEGFSSEAEAPVIRIKNISEIEMIETEHKEIQVKTKNIHYSVGAIDDEADAFMNPLDYAVREKDIKIIYPIDLDSYVLNNYAGSQVIKLQAVAAHPVPYIDWYVNSKLYKRTKPPYQTYWLLKRGNYRITAVGPSNNGDSVQVRVE